ncbi:MAG: hypothetical protein AB7U35_04540 [Sphingobium sp.]
MGLRRKEQVDEENAGSEGEFLLMNPIPGNDGRLETDPFDVRDAAFDGFADDAQSSRWIAPAKAILVLAGLGWVAFAGYLFFTHDFRLPEPEQIPSAAAGLCAPLILLALLYMMLSRGSMSETRRFAKITTRLRNEADALDMRLAVVNQQLEAARQHMHDQASLLENYGGSASLNLEATAKTLAQHATTSAQQAEIIERAGLSLTNKLGQLMDMMPGVEERADRISTTLADGSDALTDKVDRLETRLETVMRLVDEARSRTSGATQSLTAQLMQIQDATRSASDEVIGMSDLSSSRIAAAIDDARRSLEEIGVSLDVRTSDLGTLVKESRMALENVGGEAINAYDANIGLIESRLRGLDQMVKEQSAALSTVGEDLYTHIGRVEDQFVQLESRTTGGVEQLTLALDALSRRTLELDTALQSGSSTAESMIARSESLLLALDASVRELDESHPAALARLDERIEESRRLLTALTPEIEQLEAVSAAILGRARETEELLGGQGQKLDEWLERGDSTLASCQDQVAALQRAMEAADSDAKRLTDSTGPQLVATLLRVKETAEQAGERARQALSHAISQATSELGDASEAALAERLGETFRARIEEVSTIADHAVKAAHAASDRLMRQLITIADTTASIEQRITEADEAAERRDRDNFSRQSAMLIDTLNSAAIDISRILSTDVGDVSWNAYLRGDRGVFTRRAVRLIDEGQTRAIQQLYGENEAFSETVNRYIHDFEAMLRTILQARDGSSIAVTLLSSDIGKLYVALAQAIDRLKD